MLSKPVHIPRTRNVRTYMLRQVSRNYRNVRSILAVCSEISIYEISWKHETTSNTGDTDVGAQRGA